MVTRLTAVSGSTTVTFLLMGDVDEARMQRETWLCQRRANQLEPVVRKPRRQYVPEHQYVQGVDDGHDGY